MARYQYNPIDIFITLAEYDLTIYNLGRDLFPRTIDINDDTFAPEGNTGTWTTLSLFFLKDRKRDIDSINTGENQIKTLYVSLEETTKSVLED